MTIAIDSLVASAARARVQFDTAAEALSSATLPMAAPDGSAPGPDALPVNTDVDVAEQMVTMMVSSQVHQATIAALRSAMASYSSMLDIVSARD